MHRHPRRWRPKRVARASALAALSLGAGALQAASGPARLDELFGCTAGHGASFIERAAPDCGEPLWLQPAWRGWAPAPQRRGGASTPQRRGGSPAPQRRSASPGRSDAETHRDYFGPGDAWANPLMWFLPGEPMHDEVVRIASPHSVTYAPVLFPNAVFRRIEVGQTFAPGAPPPANGFVITPSSVLDPGLFVDRGAGSFAPVLMQTDPSRTLRALSMEVGLGNRREGALLISAGAVRVDGRLTLGGDNGEPSQREIGGLGYLRLAGDGAGPPTLSVGTDLKLGGNGGQAFIQQEAGRIDVAGSLLIDGESIVNRRNSSFMNLVGGTLAVGQDSVIGLNTWNALGPDRLLAGVRQGAARHEVGRDLLVGGRGSFADYETLSGAVVSVGRDLLIGAGAFGHGNFRHGGGEVIVARDLIVGAVDGGSGLFSIDGAAKVQVGGRFVVGGPGHGELRVSGSPLALAGDLMLGSGGVGLATVYSELAVQGRLSVGEAGGQGTLVVAPGARLSAGQLLLPGDSWLGSSFEARAGSVASVGEMRSSRSVLLRDGARLSVATDWTGGGLGDRSIDIRGGSTVSVGRDLLLDGPAFTGWYQEDSSATVARHVRVGIAGAAGIELQGSARLSVGADLVLGSGSGASGIFSINPNSVGQARDDRVALSVTGATLIGDGGTGSLLLANGRAELGLVRLGTLAGSAGFIDLAEHGRLSAETLIVGTAGSGQLTMRADPQSAAMPVLTAGSLIVGAGSGPGVVEASAGSIQAGALLVGANGRLDLSGTATLRTGWLTIDSAGSVNLPGRFTVDDLGAPMGAQGLDLGDAVRLTVPELAIGPGGTFQGGYQSVLAADRVFIDGGVLGGVLQTTPGSRLEYRGGDTSRLDLQSHGTVAFGPAWELGSLSSFADLAVEAGQRLLVSGRVGSGLRLTRTLHNAGHLDSQAQTLLYGADAKIVQTGGTSRFQSVQGNGEAQVGTVDLRGGQMTVSQQFSHGRLRVTGGELSVGGLVEVSELYEQTGGSVSIAGLLRADPTRPASLNLLGGSLVAGRIEIGGDLQPAVFWQSGGSLQVGGGVEVLAGGSLRLDGGTFEASALDITRRRLRNEVPPGAGRLVLSDGTGQGLMLNGGPITNSGLVKWSRGDVGGTSRLVNAADGTFEIETGPSTFSLPIDNAGTMVVRSLAQPRLAARLDHSGSLQIEQGAWARLQGGASGAGRITVAGQLTLDGGSGDFQLGGAVDVGSTGAMLVAGNAVFTGSGQHAGLVQIYGATLSLSGAQWRFGAGGALMGSGGSFALRAGSVDFDAGSSLLAWLSPSDAIGLELTGGSLRMNAGSHVAFPQRFAIEGSAVSLSTGQAIRLAQDFSLSAGRLDGFDDLALDSGRFSFSGGTLAGPGALTIERGALLALGGASPMTLDRTVHLKGQGLLSFGDIAGTGLLRLESFTDLVASGPYSMAPAVELRSRWLSNPGSAGTGSLLGRVDIIGSELRAVSGRLRLAGGGSSDGAVVALAGATVEFGGASDFVFDGGPARITGAGAVEFTGGRTLLRNGARLESTGTQRVAGGTLELGGGAQYSFVEGLSIDSGALRVSTGGGDFVLPQGMVMRGGGLVGDDARRIAAGRQLDWLGGAIGGPAATTVAAGGQLRIAGAAAKSLDSDLLNQGLLRWEGGNVGGSGRLTNAAGARVEIDGSGNLSPLLVNQGLTRILSASNPQVSLAGGLNNTGTLELQGGRLTVSGRLHNLFAGTLAGGTWALAGTLAHAEGAITTLEADLRLSGAAASMRSLQGIDVLDSLQRIGSTGRLLVESGRHFTLANRNLAVDGRFEVGSGSILTAASGSLSGAGVIQLRDGARMDWTRTNLNATGTLSVDAGGALVIADAGSNHEHAGRTLVNQGLVQWTGGDLRAGNGSAITNAGLWEDQAGSTGHSVNNFGGNQVLTFTNSGTYRKTGTGTTQFHGQRLDNSGRVEVLEGALQLNAGGVNRSGGVIDIAQGRVLRLASSDFVFEDGSAVTGAGVLVLDGANSPPVSTIDGRVSFSNLVLQAGKVAGTHTLDGRITWMRGILGAGGTTTIAPTATLVIADAGSNHEHAGRTLVNQGLVQWTGGDLRAGNGSAITNAGLWEDQAGSTGHSVNNFGGNQVLTFTNSGTYRKSGTGTTQFHGQRLDNGGRVEVQQGTLQLNAGVVQMQGGQLNGGQWEIGPGASLVVAGVTSLPVNLGVVSLRGAGSVFAPINALADNRGEFRISEGRNFTTSGNLLNSGLLFAGAGSVLTVNGALTSSGTLGGGGEIRVLGEAHVTGQVNPGASPGVLRIDGNLSLDAGSLLNIEIEGLNPGTGYDRLLVTGRATLGGALAVHLPSGFEGLAGASFTILSASQVVGQFSGLADGDFVNVAGLDGRFIIDYRSDAVVLERFTAAVPEPQTYAMLLSGLALLGWMARRRRAPAGVLAGDVAKESSLRR